MSVEAAEYALMRDLLYVFQGIDGKYIMWVWLSSCGVWLVLCVIQNAPNVKDRYQNVLNVMKDLTYQQIHVLLLALQVTLQIVQVELA